MTYVLIYNDGNGDVKREVNEKELEMGRAPECGLTLSQPGVSRRHCRIAVKDDGVLIEDLGSKNGTRVNGVYIKSSKLANGDEIQIGDFPIRFQESTPRMRTMTIAPEPPPQVVLSSEKELHEEAGTIIRQANEVRAILAEYERKEEDSPQAPVSKIQDGGRQIMSVLIEVAQALIQVKTLDAIIKKVMDLVFENLPADRGVLMLENEDKHLITHVVKHKNPQKENNDIVISSTIAMKVYQESVAILTTDAQVDPRFSAGESIRFLGIKSAMCVPLFHNNRAIGLIYLDSPTSAAVFGPSDLDLMTALANFAAVGIEQAMLTEKIERESRIRQRLERYHSPSIVSRILKKSSAEAGLSGEYSLSVQERDVTVLFADIVGFTPMSERFAPSKIAHLLNDYFSEMTEVIFKYEGTLDKYIGDAIMAVFGAPNVMTDHHYRAVCTGVEMVQKLNALNLRRSEEDRFAIRIGINSGRAVAGDIGSIKRMEYTVLGNTVNVASRIESMACPPNQVVVGAATYEHIKDHFQCESLGPIRLKGISEEMPVYRIDRHL